MAQIGTTYRVIRENGQRLFWRGGMQYYTTDAHTSSGSGPHEYKLSWEASWLPAATSALPGHGPCIGGRLTGGGAPGDEHICIQRFCCGGPNAGIWFNGGSFGGGSLSSGSGWAR